VNSIVLSHEEYEQYHAGDKTIIDRVKEAGIDPFVGVYIENKSYGVIVSNERVQEVKGIYLASQVPLIKDIRMVWNDQKEVKEPEVNKTEVVNIFNELLDEWYHSELTVINDRSVNMEKDQEDLFSDRAKYRKRFAEALGVPYE
jgi:hypothetical protein